jgi:hypothetical protein
VSTNRSPGPYQVFYAPAARGPLAALPRRDRMALERRLQELAQVAGMRHWISPEECAEPLQLRVDGHEVTCQLEPDTRTLRVTALRGPAP